MNIPRIDRNLPGFDEVVNAEIGILREDIERIEGRFAEACQRAAETAAQLRKLADLQKRLDQRAADLATETQTLKRMLVARRRALFDLQQDVE